MSSTGMPHIDLGHKMLDFGNKVMGAVGNLAKQAQAATAPLTPEATAIGEKGRNVNEYIGAVQQPQAPAQAPAADNSAVQSTDRAEQYHQAAQDQAAPAAEAPAMNAYGSQPGEQRIDTTEMTKPLGQVRSFDNGGDVDKDQVALVHQGEKVLNPNEADQYRQEHGEDGVGTIATPDQAHDADQHQPGAEGGGAPAAPAPTMMKPLPGGEPVNAPSLPNPTAVGKPEPTMAVPPVSEMETSALPAVSPERNAAMKPMPGTEALPDKKTEQQLAQQAAQEKYQADRKALLDRRDKAIMSGNMVDIGNAKHALIEFDKAHPWGSDGNHPGTLGKIGHVLAGIGNAVGSIVAPEVMGFIPGTPIHEHYADAAAMQQARQGAEIQKDVAEAENKGGADKVTDATQRAQWAKLDQQSQQLEQQVAAETDPAKKTALQNQLTTVNSQRDSIGDSLGLGKKGGSEKEDNQPATDQQVQDVNTRLENNPYIPKDAMAKLQFPAGYKPTLGEVKQRLANIKEIEDAKRTGNQDAFNDALKKMLGESTLQARQEKEQKAQTDASNKADVRTANLYTQENYDDAMQDWYRSGHFAKDSGLVSEIVNKEKSGEKGSLLSGAMGDTLVGGLFGPEGAAIGAGVGAVTNMLSGTFNGYLDTLKKQGISDEGYKAMQAYFNTLPGRFAYESDIQKLNASAMRSSQLIQKVLNTVPAPNTPQSAWRNSFDTYFNPMKSLTERAISRETPKGYTAPTFQQIYGRERTNAQAAPAAKAPAKAEAPKGKTPAPAEAHPEAPKSVDEFHGKKYLTHADGSAWENQNGKIVQVRQAGNKPM